MHYKSIVLELLKEQTDLHEKLRKERRLLSTVDLYARELKISHEAWQDLLAQVRRGTTATQLASEALEMALKELEDRLPSASHRNDNEAVFLDAAMLFIRRRHSSPG